MTKRISRIAVFCGASAGNKPEYTELAKKLAEAMVKENISLVYGGGRVGLMGILGSEVMRLGGEVIGVIPDKLARKEVADTAITHLHLVASMHERKALMSELADGFIMLPGGIGTLDEFFEEMTSVQLGYHNKPCGILNIANYYDALLQFLKDAVASNFFSMQFCNRIIVEKDPAVLLQQFFNYQEPQYSRWEAELQHITS